LIVEATLRRQISTLSMVITTAPSLLLWHILAIMTLLVPFLHVIIDDSHKSVVEAYVRPNHQRIYNRSLLEERSSTCTFWRDSRLPWRSVPPITILPIQKQSNIMQLHLMNWFGFGTSNEGENISKDSSVQPQDTASAAFLNLQKENSRRNGSKGSDSGGGGVVAIMDSMDQLKRSQRIGKMTAALVQELKAITVEGSSDNGKIKVILDGQQNPISTYIDENYYKDRNVDSRELTAAFTTAMKDARIKSIEKMNEKMKNVYNELGFDTSQ
jgi:DNA-binding protein YbaB